MLDLRGVAQLFKNVARHLNVKVLVQLFGRTVVAQHAADAQKRDFVAEVDVGHIVGDHQHRAVLVAQTAAQLHHAAVQIGRKAARRLVQDQQTRVRQQLHGDGNTLFLAAGQLGDKRLFTPLQIDSLNGVGHGGGDLGAGRIVGNAQLGRVGQALLHGQVVVHDVLLRHVTERGLKGVAVGAGVQPVKLYAARRAGGRARDAGQQARFARAGAAHQHDKAVGLDLQACAVHDVQRLAGVGIFNRFVYIYKLYAYAALVGMIVEHPAREGKNLRRHVDDRAVAQHRAGHADAVHIGAVRRAEVMQLVVAVLVQNLAVMAGDTVIDELDVAVVAAPDEYAALAADVCLAQDGVGGLLLFRGHAVALHAGDLLDAEGDLLRVRVAVGVQADDVAALQNTRLAGLKIAVVVPGAVVAEDSQF